MKIYFLRNYLAGLAIIMAVPYMQAQFDDVYYDPDAYIPDVQYNYGGTIPGNTAEDEVTYYDNDEFAYYDDYSYYSTRINRFYRPYMGFGFYSPAYMGYGYYDPYGYDYYGYAGSGFYMSFGIGFGSYWNNWYYPSYNYWGGYYPYGNCGYHSYGNYYPPYYGGGCNGGYYPGNGHGGHGDYHGDQGDHYYGPRITGNTGSSPRGPAVSPGIVRPVDKNNATYVTQANDQPLGLPESGTPGRAIPSGSPVVTGSDHTPAQPAPVREVASTEVVRQVPVDKELPRDVSVPGPKRPVFRPDVEKYQPYPTIDRSNPSTNGPAKDTPSATPRDNFKPYPGSDRTGSTGTPDKMPAYSPPARNNQDRPSYSPPPRSNDRTQQAAPSRGNDRPSYSPPSRQDSPGSNDRPSYSPPSRQDSPGSNSRSSYSPPSSGRSPSSGGGSSNRSSGGGGSSSHQSSSPRGKG